MKSRYIQIKKVLTKGKSALQISRELSRSKASVFSDLEKMTKLGLIKTGKKNKRGAKLFHKKVDKPK